MTSLIYHTLQSLHAYNALRFVMIFETVNTNKNSCSIEPYSIDAHPYLLSQVFSTAFDLFPDCINTAKDPTPAFSLAPVSAGIFLKTLMNDPSLTYEHWGSINYLDDMISLTKSGYKLIAYAD